MRLDELLFEALTNDATVVGLVTARVYPHKLPQSPTLPAVTYQLVSRVPTEANTELFDCRVQLDCWSGTYAGATTLAIAVLNALRFYRKGDGGNTLLSIYDSNYIDDYDDEREIYRVIVDVIAMYHES
ncbi:MAG: DUF3168 domain-containing protein [Caldilineaceae bacterium]